MWKRSIFEKISKFIEYTWISVAQAMVDLKLEGQWRVHQTACGLLISFMREDDLMTFQNLDLSNVLGLPASAFGFSSLDTYRQVSITPNSNNTFHHFVIRSRTNNKHGQNVNFRRKYGQWMSCFL